MTTGLQLALASGALLALGLVLLVARLMPAEPEDSSFGSPTAATGAATMASSQPVRSQATTPPAKPTSSRVRVVRSSFGSRPGRRDEEGAGRTGVGRRPMTTPMMPATISAPASAGTRAITTARPAP
jgi:hypothetical protein